MNNSIRQLLQIWDQMVVVVVSWCRQLKPVGKSPGGIQTAIPEVLRREVLPDLHEGTMGGHLGIDKTLGRLQERFYWPGHYNDVRDWCRNCAVCASRKSSAPKARAPLKPIMTSYPLQLVAMDIVGPFPESPTGNSYILVIADYFTRYTEAYAIPNQEATTVANKLVEEFFLQFSPAEQLHSDQGRNFESAIITEVCKLLGVEKTRTTPYHPQSDGLVERFNRTLLDMLATAVSDKPFEWEQHLRRLCFAYNTSIHPTTGFSPFSLMFGRQAHMPVDIALGTACTVPEYVANLRTSLDAAYTRVRNQMGHHLEQQKIRYDAKTCGKPFEAGDLVWLHSPAIPRGRSKKLHRPWTGPYRVVTRLSEVVYCLQHTQCRRKRPVVHFDRLKPCSQNTRLTEANSQYQRPQVVQPSPRPLGTNLELLDDDDPEYVMDAPSEDRPAPTDSPGGHLHVAAPDPVAPPDSNVCPPHGPSSDTLQPPSPRVSSPRRRYPQRERLPPVRSYETVMY